ncbi:protein SENESCENCE-ASSOCIATED GENE 21, mitochondrial [Impatiens glandulifera]|uniref:protein SENESCENCE-ASSOCIATED GENE 21, mitochondrial n=1 Tax=Impatiens glandulifera TaxID=253017 RepID=UPI001FB06E26|nr:protein SENESCENCE-ASSOCIATED GENE 21, mitochondrial [Impatiens glandulifera]
MARSIANAKVFSVLIADAISVSRRGYSAASSQAPAVTGSVRSGGINLIPTKGSEESLIKSPWVPDPKTGFYRPENHPEEMDAAVLREMVLKNSARQN